VRKNAASALGKIGDARVVEPLINVLEDKDPKVRKEAAGSLNLSENWETDLLSPIVLVCRGQLNLPLIPTSQIGQSRGYYLRVSKTTLVESPTKLDSQIPTQSKKSP
jgi:hypothetical protein